MYQILVFSSTIIKYQPPLYASLGNSNNQSWFKHDQSSFCSNTIFTKIQPNLSCDHVTMEEKTWRLLIRTGAGPVRTCTTRSITCSEGTLRYPLVPKHGTSKFHIYVDDVPIDIFFQTCGLVAWGSFMNFWMIFHLARNPMIPSPYAPCMVDLPT